MDLRDRRRQRDVIAVWRVLREGRRRQQIDAIVEPAKGRAKRRPLCHRRARPRSDRTEAGNSPYRFLPRLFRMAIGNLPERSHRLAIVHTHTAADTVIEVLAGQSANTTRTCYRPVETVPDAGHD